MITILCGECYLYSVELSKLYYRKLAVLTLCDYSIATGKAEP